MQISTTATFWGLNNNQAYVGSNSFYDQAGNFKYIVTDSATQYRQWQGAHTWFTAPSGTAGNAITFTQAMTLDASGNLLVGITSGSYKFMVGDGTRDMCINPNSALDAIFLGTTTNKPLVFGTNNTERARIDTSGNLLIGKTTTSATTAGVELKAAGDVAFVNTFGNGVGENIFLNRQSGTGDFVLLRYANGTVGSISTNGTTTTYATSSDYRLKNTIAPMTGALAKVALLKPCTYKWNADGSDGEGFIAHELDEVVPECVTGPKDAVDEEGNPKYQGIDTSFLVATLTAALQELNAKFDAYVASHP
jgi:hypothetical protein